MRKILLLLVLISFVAMQAFAQRTVTGTVTAAEDGSSLPGVSVLVKGTTVRTVTDFNGGFSINVPAGGTTLVFEFMGMETQEVAITGDVVNAVLKSSDISLDDVVVTGYGIQKKREVTGAISQVKGKDLATLVAPSFEANLAGKSAGVQVTASSGVLGETPRFRIRGISSISSGTYPLIVVDGSPIFTGDLGGYASNNALADINPADIESVEILKDGSATALYGSRAANGVVLVTTKKGTQGKVNINYNNYFGFSQAVNLFELLNAEEFVMIANEKRSNRNQSALAVASGIDTDWQEAVLRKQAYVQDHNLSMLGGTDKTNYYFSVGYTAQEGVSRPNEMKRYTMRANLDQKAFKWLTFGANISASKSDYFGMNTGTNALSGNITNATKQLPNTPVFDPTHPTGYNIDLINPRVVGRGANAQIIDDNYTNIRYTLDKNVYASKKMGLTSAFSAKMKILPYLTFVTQLSGEYSGVEGFLYWNPIHGDGQGSNGRVQNDFTQNIQYQWQNVLTFSKKFDKHNVDLVLVNENAKTLYNNFSAIGTDLSNEFFNQNVISGSFGTQASGGGKSQTGILSYLAKFNYNFASKYFLQASFRRDGISNLPLANRWGSFPGFSAGWTISEESFMEGIRGVVSDLKFRGSYAEVGNVSIGAFPYLGLYSGQKYADYNAIAFNQIGNDQLKWETSTKLGAGLDLALLDGKYRVTFDYYMNKIDGMILFVPLPMSYGVPFNGISMNVGEQENWGYEFSVDATLLRTADFTLAVDANLTLAGSKINKLVDGKDILGAYTIVREGSSRLDIYGYEYWGVNPANGNPVYIKGDGTLIQGNIPTSSYFNFDPANPTDLSTANSLSSTADRKILGTALPTYYGSFSIKANYKNFDFNMMWRYSGGNMIMNRTRLDLLNQKFQNNSKEILGRWQSPSNPGDGTTPRLWYAGDTFINFDLASTRWVEKGDFLKLSNIYLGYTLPKNLVKRIGINNLKVFAQAQDLFMFTQYTGIDPEMESGGVDWNGTPKQRTFTFGINLGL